MLQARAIPIGRFGADLITQAKSGTGKTCMFAVIVLDTLKLDFRTPQAAIISPTRELAHQTRDVVRGIGTFMAGLGCEAFVGGMSTSDDVTLLTRPGACCHVVTGTPGRLRALIEMGALAVEGLRQLVLDEADVLLSDDFRPQIDVLFGILPLRKQVMAVSATYSKELLALVRGYMREPQEVSSPFFPANPIAAVPSVFRGQGVPSIEFCSSDAAATRTAADVRTLAHRCCSCERPPP